VRPVARGDAVRRCRPGGKGLADPIGTFWSCVMLLEHPGEAAAARTPMAAIGAATADPMLHTRDLGGSATTR